MNKIKDAIKRELTGWKKWEIIWLLIATAVILGVSIYWKDSPTGILAALTGIWCVILTGKGKLSSFWIGTHKYSVVCDCGMESQILGGSNAEPYLLCAYEFCWYLYVVKKYGPGNRRGCKKETFS